MTLPTHIPRLDALLGGGLPPGRSLLYYIQPGIEGNVFGLQTAICNIEAGRDGVFVVSTSHPARLGESAASYGWDWASARRRLHVIDLFSGLSKTPSDADHVVDEPEDIARIDAAVSRALEERRGSLMFFESLSSIMDMCGEEATLDRLRRWLALARVNDCFVIANFTAWPYSDAILAEARGTLFNGVVRVGGVGERVLFGQYYGVLRADWVSSLRETTLLFKVTRPGGVHVYIPKVLVTGPFHAGKTSFVRALSTRSVSVDRLGTTIALDFGHIVHKEFAADIFGTPGQERFDPILQQLGGQALGVFLVVDSTDPACFPRAKQMLESTRTFGLPLVVVANKQDLPKAMPPEEVRERMKLPASVAIVPASVKEGRGVIEAFETLMSSIVQV